ncbi:hypothetical protein, partial [Thiolapillus sp.]|uniref:hypothetical protein n=2 Tax=Thiolapillus sp. TaxID=2017437 RepID=UPI003AF730D7
VAQCLVTRTAGAPIGCQRPSRFWGLGCPKIYHEAEDTLVGYDSYRRFIQLFGKVALGIADELFDEEFNKVKERAHVTEDVGLSADNLRDISERFLAVVEKATGRPFPEDPYAASHGERSEGW